MKIKTVQRIGYISEIDQFLKDFDENNPELSNSRLKEINKHQKIFAKRDAVIEDVSSPIWKEF